MRLFIAEKPNLAKAIANALGNDRKEDGYIRCGDDVVTWCFGHMLELAGPQDYKPEYAQWRREHLPIIPSEWKYKVRKDAAKQLRIIGSLLREADSVVNGGDPDREGQLLVDEVLEHFNYRGPVARIWLPSLDDKSVRIALDGIRDNAPYAPLRDAARARRLADWLVGINATRTMTIKGREGGRSETLSLGRVQTPTLALVVARDREIASFKPIDYLVLRASLVHSAGEFAATFVPGETQAGLDSSGRLIDAAVADALIAGVKGANELVAEAAREAKTKAAPLPHSLSSLQKAASAQLGMSAQQVLDTAQSLYERKLTTYPRTDCRHLPNEQFDGAAAVLTALSSVPGLEQVAGTADASLKSSAWNTQKVTAHHAIAPTGEMPPDNLKPAERSLYLMIATAFCLQFHSPMRYEARKIAVSLADTQWEVTGRRLTDAGWTAFSKDEEDDRQEEASLPPVEQGDVVTCRTVESVKKKTSPPSRFSEGTLIEAMANVHRFVGDTDAKATLRETKDILTHCLLFGTTGSGKTETLVSLSYNALATASGLFYIDPKASPKLAVQIWQMARFLGRDDDFRVLNYGTSGKVKGKSPRRLSNTNNPFTFGSAEALTQLLVSLMPASDGANSIFADKAQALISGVMYALVDLRDKGLLKLSTSVIRDSLALEKCVELALRPELDEESRASIQAALGTCGWITGREMKDQPQSFPEQFGYAQSYFGKALSSLTDTYSHIYGAEDGEVDFADAIMQRRILVVLLPSLEKAPAELASLGKISLSAIRNACAVGLGAHIEGDAADVLEALPTDTVGIGPYLCIVDEYAAIVTPGFEVVLTQGRGLGIAAIVASQDYAGILEADKNVGADTRTSRAKHRPPHLRLHHPRKHQFRLP